MSVRTMHVQYVGNMLRLPADPDNPTLEREVKAIMTNPFADYPQTFVPITCNDYNEGLLPDPCLRLPYGSIFDTKSIELGDGSGYLPLHEFPRWHLMADERPTDSIGTYVIMGKRGAVYLALGFDNTPVFGKCFLIPNNRSGLMEFDKVKAWLKVPAYGEV